MKIYFFLIYLFFYCNCYSQNSLNKVYSKFDSIINLKNTSISYGELYREKFRKLKGNHNFFNEDKFQKGTIKYDNQIYYNVNLKYDIVDDDLIVSIPDLLNKFLVILNKQEVEYFKIDDKIFLYKHNIGYAEKLISSSKINVFKKHFKIPLKKFDDNFLHYSFSKKEKFYINIDDNLTEIKTKNDFIKLFPTHKGIIKKFYKKENNLRKRNYTLFIKTLIGLINNNIEGK